MKTCLIAVTRYAAAALALSGLSYITHANPINLIENGSFEDSWGSWKSSAKAGIFLGYPGAADGTQWAGVFVNLYQDIATIPGQHYHLSFAIAGESKDGKPVVANVSWDDKFVSSTMWNPSGHTVNKLGWIYRDIDLVATDTSTRLLFENAYIADRQTVFLDDVTVEPIASVPDSASVILLPSVTFGLVCFARKRRGSSLA